MAPPYWTILYGEWLSTIRLVYTPLTTSYSLSESTLGSYPSTSGMLSKSLYALSSRRGSPSLSSLSEKNWKLICSNTPLWRSEAKASYMASSASLPGDGKYRRTLTFAISVLTDRSPLYSASRCSRVLCRSEYQLWDGSPTSRHHLSAMDRSLPASS